MFVERDVSNNIVGCYPVAQPGHAAEEVADNDPALLAFLNPPIPQSVLSQDLMAQFTADDAAKIQAAVAGSVPFWLLWSSMQAQRDPMWVTNARFKSGWAALVTVLGQTRMDAISAALGVTVVLP